MGQLIYVALLMLCAKITIECTEKANGSVK